MTNHHEKGLAPSKNTSFSMSLIQWQTLSQVFIASACKRIIGGMTKILTQLVILIETHPGEISKSQTLNLDRHSFI